jgi:hypothetical protein
MRLVHLFLAFWLVDALVLVAGPLARAGDAPDAGAARLTYYDRLVVETDLAGRSLDDLSLMRNTIYARAGRRFDDPKLRDHFAHQPWYRPGPSLRFGPIDIANLRAIAEQERALRFRPVIFPCRRTRSDGTVVDRRAADMLLALAQKLRWSDDYGFPDCHRRVQLRCGPDLDGDGEPESIVRIEGYVLLNGKSCEKNMTDTNDFWPVAKTLVVSGGPGRWRALQALGSDIQGDQQSESTTAGFVRLRDGRFAIEYYVRSFDGGNGCEGRGSTIYEVNRGNLKIIEDIPDPVPCDEQ